MTIQIVDHPYGYFSYVGVVANPIGGEPYDRYMMRNLRDPSLTFESIDFHTDGLTAYRPSQDDEYVPGRISLSAQGLLMLSPVDIVAIFSEHAVDVFKYLREYHSRVGSERHFSGTFDQVAMSSSDYAHSFESSTATRGRLENALVNRVSALGVAGTTNPLDLEPRSISPVVGGQLLETLRTVAGVEFTVENEVDKYKLEEAIGTALLSYVFPLLNHTALLYRDVEDTSRAHIRSYREERTARQVAERATTEARQQVVAQERMIEQAGKFKTATTSEEKFAAFQALMEIVDRTPEPEPATDPEPSAPPEVTQTQWTPTNWSYTSA